MGGGGATDGQSSEVYMKTCLPTCPRPNPEHVLSPKDPGLTHGEAPVAVRGCHREMSTEAGHGAGKASTVPSHLTPTGPSTFPHPTQRLFNEDGDMMGMHHMMGKKLMIKCDNCTLVSTWSAAGTVQVRSYELSHLTLTTPLWTGAFLSFLFYAE